MRTDDAVVEDDADGQWAGGGERGGVDVVAPGEGVAFRVQGPGVQGEAGARGEGEGGEGA